MKFMQYILSNDEWNYLQSKIANLESAVEHSSVFVMDTMTTLDDVKSKYVKMVVDSCKGNVSEAAVILGVHRQTVAMLLKASAPQ